MAQLPLYVHGSDVIYKILDKIYRNLIQRNTIDCGPYTYFLKCIAYVEDSCGKEAPNEK